MILRNNFMIQKNTWVSKIQRKTVFFQRVFSPKRHFFFFQDKFMCILYSLKIYVFGYLLQVFFNFLINIRLLIYYQLSQLIIIIIIILIIIKKEDLFLKIVLHIQARFCKFNAHLWIPTGSYRYIQSFAVNTGCYKCKISVGLNQRWRLAYITFGGQLIIYVTGKFGVTFDATFRMKY